MKIMGLGTYPIRKPVHGGQRRVSAFAAYYASVGITYCYASVYQGAHYSKDDVSERDVPLFPMARDPYRSIPLVDDLRAGWQAAGGDDDRVFDRLREIIAREAPDVFQIEQPFMWPLVQRLRSFPEWRSVPLIYSSQNVEAPLKLAMLRQSGVAPADIETATAAIQSIEAEACAAASLVIACSKGDAHVYQQMRCGGPVVCVPNGVDRPLAPSAEMVTKLKAVYAGKPFAFFVGSAYPPNIQGFVDMVVGDGMFFVPPEKRLAICGGLCDGVFQAAGYHSYLEAHSARVNFFPSPTDAELVAIKQACHVILLPITFGGGSNLKTAEAIASGKWIVATPTALRGYEDYLGEPGLIVAETPGAFRKAISEVLRRPALELSAAQKATREGVYWDAAFKAARLNDFIPSLQSGRLGLIPGNAPEATA